MLMAIGVVLVRFPLLSKSRVPLATVVVVPGAVR